MVNLKPLGNNVIIEKTPEETVTKSGIVLPDNVKEKPQTGKVIAVGSGKVLDNGTRSDVEVSVGDIVCFSKYSGTEVKIDDEEYTVLPESDILAILN